MVAEAPVMAEAEARMVSDKVGMVAKAKARVVPETEA